LAALAEVAAMLARGGSVAQDLENVLAIIVGTLDARECVLWLAAPGGIERGWAIGDEETTPEVIRELLDADESERDDLVVARLHTGEERLGALTLRRQRELAADERLFLFTVADVLAPVLRDAAHTHSLQTKVLERTRALEEQRRFTGKIIDSLPVGLYVIDRDYRIQAWNHKRETGMQGVSREEALGRPIFEILHRQPEPLLRREFDDVFATGTIQQFQMESNASGELRTYRISKIPMRLDDSAISHVITIGEDVTEWREAQERFAQAEKLAAIGTLAAGVMHEINNPLATIGACAESLTLRLDDGVEAPEPFLTELREMLRVIEHEVQRCTGIVRSLLDFSRPKPATKSLVDVNVVVDKTLFLLKHHSRFKKIVVQTALDKRVPPVHGSEEQLIQVVMALLINAMDALPDDGKIALRTIGNAEHEQDAVVIEVIDQGSGIRRADLQKIFEPFYTTKPPGRGTGLGLSICYAIIREHGGRIEVESEVGSGSVFRIVLPKEDHQE
jgi:two-component system, NtrC family, sensor kinase